MAPTMSKQSATQLFYHIKHLNAKLFSITVVKVNKTVETQDTIIIF